jgi:hypothetical protein
MGQHGRVRSKGGWQGIMQTGDALCKLYVSARNDVVMMMMMEDIIQN